MQHRISLPATACTALAAALLLASPGTAPAVEAGGGAAPASGKSGPVTFEAVPGSDAKRIILEPKAVERLGLETVKVTEGTIVRTQMVGGLVVPPVKDPAPQVASRGGSFGQVLGCIDIQLAQVGLP